MPEQKPRKISPSVLKEEKTDNDELQEVEHEVKVEPEDNTQMHFEEIKPFERDKMRTEPILTSLITKTYDGKIDENGFFHKEGRVVFKSCTKYDGIFEHGKMHGSGVLNWPNDTVYSGDFVYNTLTGKGTYTWADSSSYEGDVLNGLRHGVGTFRCIQENSYTGQWKHGKRHGKGIIYYDSTGESYYDGDWIENEKCGYGIRRFKNDNIYEGYWKNNVRHGIGRMCWFNIGQEYYGNWENGIQNGHGENIWYLKRIGNSQYPLRNRYVGNFVNGERDGTGIFYYASGASYEGGWKQNMKHGHGKFTFKNGYEFKGEFNCDHMVDYPDLILSGMTTPDISQTGIPVSSPSPLRSSSARGVVKVVDAVLDVDIEDLLRDYKYDLEERQREIDNIVRIVLRFTTPIKKLYKVYSCIGWDSSPDNTFVMTKLQFLRFLKDFQLHKHGFSIIDIERYLEDFDVHFDDCHQTVFIRDFLNRLMKISSLLYKDEVGETSEKLSTCFAKLVNEITQNSSVVVKGALFHSTEVYQEFAQYLNNALEVYFYFLAHYKNCFTMRKCLLLFNELNLINEDLTAAKMVKVLTSEDKIDGYYNLDTEMCALDFLEVLICTSSIFVSTAILQQYPTDRLIASDEVPESENIPTAHNEIITVKNKANKCHCETESVSVKKTEGKIDSDITTDNKKNIDNEGDHDGDENVGSRTLHSKSSASVIPSTSSYKLNKHSSFNKRPEKEKSHSVISSKSKEKKENSKLEKKIVANKSVTKADDVSTVPHIKTTSEEDKNERKDSIKMESCDDVMESFTTQITDSDGKVTEIISMSIRDNSSINSSKCKHSHYVNAYNNGRQTWDVFFKENFDVFARKLHIFFNNYLFPAFQQRKFVDAVKDTTNTSSSRISQLSPNTFKCKTERDKKQFEVESNKEVFKIIE